MKRSILFLVALGAMGCGQHPVDEYVSITNDVSDDVCACPDVVAALMYSSEADCKANFLPALSETQTQCFKDAYDRNESVASSTFDCTLDESRTFRDCVSNASCNAAALQTCASSYDVEAHCPALPASVQAEFDACGGM